MKPGFALILSHDGISLLHRANGGWRCLGKADPNAADLAKDLRYLQRTATELSGGQFATKLVIPNSQILYRKIDALGATDKRRTEVIHDALDGTTPYPIDDLVFDWCDAGNGMAHVAVVATETLKEAEIFASEHRFNPVSFVAIPEPETFDEEPFFGETGLSETLLSSGDSVEPDDDIVAVIQQSEISDTPVVTVGDPPGAVALASHANPSGAAAPHLDMTGSGNDADAEIISQELLGSVPFATRRQTPMRPTPDQPLALKWVTPRIAFGAGAPPAAPADPDGGGQDARQVEITQIAVTAPVVGDGDIPIAVPDTDNHLFGEGRNASDEPPETSDVSDMPDLSDETERTPVIVPVDMPRTIAAIVAHQRAGGGGATGPGATGEDTVDSKNEAEALTIFGARKPGATTGRPRYLGLSVAFGLIGLILLTAVVAGNFTGTPVTSAQFWRSLSASTPDPGQGQTATAVVASARFGDENPAPQQETAPEGIEVASLSPPNISVAELATDPGEPTPEEIAEAQTDTATETGPPEILTPETAAVAYALTGIWQLTPQVPDVPAADRVDDIYVASIDRPVLSQDAVALPSYLASRPDNSLAILLPPAAAGTRFDLDERGLVRATPEGALAPSGIRVFAGKPAKVPDLRPETAPAAAPDPVATTEIVGIRPLLRPENLVARTQKARLGGRTLADIGKVRPLPRPASPQEAASPPEITELSKLAIDSSRRPAARPARFSSAVEKALAQIAIEAAVADAAKAAAQSEPASQQAAATTTKTPDPVTASAAATVVPKIPSRANVAKEATVKNAIKLSAINLIGVYGSSSNRRALVRLKSGRYVKVEVGDRLDGGRVAAIGSSDLKYVKSGHNVTLKMPTG